MIEFDSLNPYSNMEVVLGDDPVSLLALLKSINTPIKIVAIVPYGNKHAAYIVGDIRMRQIKTSSNNKLKNKGAT